MERAASATALPCAVSTSTWRSLATISSGVCVPFLPIDVPPSASASHITGGPLLGGQVSLSLLPRGGIAKLTDSGRNELTARCWRDEVRACHLPRLPLPGRDHRPRGVAVSRLRPEP